MPNWCNNFITFFGDGTPEGKTAIVDLHDRMLKTSKLMEYVAPHNHDLWEVYLAHYGYGVNIDCYQRGYIFYIGDVNEHDEFCIETDDAWSPNIQFWAALLQYFYQGHITFTFQASEPGMGIYETNDPGLLPRYTIDAYASGDELLQFDKLWDWTDPLFPIIKSEYVNNFEGYWSNWGDKSRYIRPHTEIWYNTEGDEDYVLADIDDNIMSIQPHDTIDNIPNDNIYVHEWCYVDTDSLIDGEKLCEAVCNNIFEKDKQLDIREDYGMVKPIYDNFTTFLGGNSNE